MTKKLQTQSNPKPRLVMLGDVERSIIADYAIQIGSPSASGALRQIIREWHNARTTKRKRIEPDPELANATG